MSDEEMALLRIAYQGLNGEFKRIEELITHNFPKRDKHPLGDAYPAVHNKFVGPKGEIKNSLDRLEFYAKSPTKLNEEQFKNAWKVYNDLRNEAMPAIASELLAVIGGVYLQMANLEDLGGVRDRESSLSFTDEAHALVIEMVENCGTEWQSVLIVGEERYDHYTAEVIRLRFPACDLWNLPLTAHELGFLVTYKDKAKRFVAKLNEVKQSSQKQYNPDVLRRLFADAFATAVAGPAYLYALVYLRIIPYETLIQPVQAMPVFVDRLVICLEILQWLQDDTFVRMRADSSFSSEDEKDVKDFSKIVFVGKEGEDQGVPPFWKWVMQSLNPSTGDDKIKDEYFKIRNKHSEWLAAMKEDLSKLHDAITATYKNWVEAQDLKVKLPGTIESSDSVSNRLTLLNAAWAARHENWEAYDSIESNVIKLLPRVGKQEAQKEHKEQKEPEPSTSTVDKTEASPSKNDVELVNEALKDYDFELQDFENMLKAKKFSELEVKSINNVFRKDKNYPAYDALRRIIAVYS